MFVLCIRHQQDIVILRNLCELANTNGSDVAVICHVVKNWICGKYFSTSLLITSLSLALIESLQGTHRHTRGSNPAGGSTWSCPPASPSCWGTGLQSCAGTMDMWWLFWTMPLILPFGSEKAKVRIDFWIFSIWTHLVVWFKQNLIVFREGDQKDDGGNVFETVNPLPSLWSLTSYVHHPAISTVTAMPSTFKISSLGSH